VQEQEANRESKEMNHSHKRRRHSVATYQSGSKSTERLSSSFWEEDPGHMVVCEKQRDANRRGAGDRGLKGRDLLVCRCRCSSSRRRPSRLSLLHTEWHYSRDFIGVR